MTLRTRARPLRIAGRLAVASALAVTTVGVMAPAFAERTAVKDPADATASLTDIRKVVADHGPKRVLVKVRFTDLQPTSDGGPSSIGIFLDTDGTRRGPEFMLGSGLQQGTDYQLVRMRKWKLVGEALSCAHKVALDYEADVLRFRASRPCLDDPEQVRVAVKMTDLYDASHPVVDWLKGRREFTGWLASD
jgi:hypothetical protein